MQQEERGARDGAKMLLVPSPLLLTPVWLLRSPALRPRPQDVGPWLKRKIKDHFKGTPITPDIKYFDPRNMIRTVPAATIDKVYCRVRRLLVGSRTCCLLLWAVWHPVRRRAMTQAPAFC